MKDNGESKNQCSAGGARKGADGHDEIIRRYGLLCANISDLVYFCDSNGNILFVNKVFDALTGHKAEDFFGRSFAPLFDEINLKTAMDVYARTLRGECPEYELAFKDTGIICEYKNFPDRDDDGSIIGVVGIARDITRRKRAEDELRLANLKLQDALDKVKLLSGLLPICSLCKKIRDDKGYWNHVEIFISRHSEADFTHGFCPDCVKRALSDV